MRTLSEELSEEGTEQLEITRRLSRHRLIAIDTCVFIYLMERNPQYFEAVSTVFHSLELDELSALTSTVVLTEILVQPYRNANVSQADTFYSLLTTIPDLQWVPPTLEIAQLAAALRGNFRMQTPEALIAATAVLGKATALLTNDPIFRRVTGMDVLILDEYI